LSLYLSTNNGGVEVKLHAFLTSPLVGVVDFTLWSPSPRAQSPGYHLIAGWAPEPIYKWRKKFLLLSGIEPRPSNL
jgi:hypothetical protein